ncbi:MAG: hypothetical protein ACKOPQ_05180 [Novosphingobium sp.]
MQATDGQQVRQTRIAHRVFVLGADPAAIPTGEGRRDAAWRSRNSLAHVL